MPHVNYDNIEPNIAEVDIEGATVNVKWKCPVSGRVVGESSAGMSPVATTAKKATNAAKKALLFEALGALNRFIAHDLRRDRRQDGRRRLRLPPPGGRAGHRQAGL